MTIDDYIGTVKMLPDESCECNLRAEISAGKLGDAMLIIPKDNPDYQQIIMSLGGLLPGEEKPFKKIKTV